MHYAFLVVCTPNPEDQGERIAQLLDACNERGLGFITFSNPQDMGSFIVQRDADYSPVEPQKVDEYIEQRMGSEVVDQLKQWMTVQ